MIDKRMMYSQGQRVAKTLDGSRPGYRGDDAARSSEGTSAGRSSPGAGAGYGDGPSRGRTQGNTPRDFKNLSLVVLVWHVGPWQKCLFGIIIPLGHLKSS